MDNALIAMNPGSGVFISRVEYHGKIYELGDRVFVGSSNFSENGFKSRLECNIEVSETETRRETKEYLDFLFLLDTTERLQKVELRKRQATKGSI